MPSNTAFPTGADRLHAGLFGGEATCVTLETVRLALDIGDLARRVNALDEAPAETRDRLADAVDFGQVHARPHDHFSSAPDVVIVRRPCLTPLVEISASAIFCTAPAFPRTTRTSRQLS